MGQTSAGLTWPVKTNRHHGMTMQHKLHNQRGSQVGCAMEEGNVSQREEGNCITFTATLSCSYKRLFTLKISPCEVLNGFKEAHMNRAAKSSTTIS